MAHDIYGYRIRFHAFRHILSAALVVLLGSGSVVSQEPASSYISNCSKDAASIDCVLSGNLQLTFDSPYAVSSSRLVFRGMGSASLQVSPPAFNVSFQVGEDAQLAFQNIVLTRFTLGDPATKFLSTDTWISNSGQLLFANVTVRTTDCDELLKYQQYICSEYPRFAGAMQVTATSVIISNYTADGAMWMNTQLTCPNPRPQSFQTPLPPCITATVSTGSELLSQMLQLQAVTPNNINIFISIATPSLTLTPSGVTPLAIRKSVTVSGLPGRLPPEINLNLMTRVFQFVGVGLLTLSRVKLINMPVSPAQYPMGLFTHLNWAMDFTPGGGPPNSQVRLLLDTCTVYLPGDEHELLRTMLSTNVPYTSPQKNWFFGSPGQQGAIMDVNKVNATVPTGPPHTIPFFTVASAAGLSGWAWSNVTLVTVDGTPSSMMPISPVRIPNAGLRALLMPREEEQQATAPYTPITSATQLPAQITPSHFNGAPSGRNGPPPYSNVHFIMTGNVTMLVDPATTKAGINAIQMIFVGDPTAPQSRVLDLSGATTFMSTSLISRPPTGWVSVSGENSMLFLRYMTLANLGPVTRQLADSPDSAPVELGGNGGSGGNNGNGPGSTDGTGGPGDGGGRPGRRQLSNSGDGDSDDSSVSSPPEGPGIRLQRAEEGSVDKSPAEMPYAQVMSILANYTSMLWFFTVKRGTQDSTTIKLGTLRLHNVTLVIPPLELLVIGELLKSNTTQVNISPSAKSLLMTKLALVQDTAQVRPPRAPISRRRRLAQAVGDTPPSPNQVGDIYFPEFSWFGMDGIGVTFTSQVPATIPPLVSGSSITPAGAMYVEGAAFASRPPPTRLPSTPSPARPSDENNTTNPPQKDPFSLPPFTPLDRKGDQEQGLAGYQVGLIVSGAVVGTALLVGGAVCAYFVWRRRVAAVEQDIEKLPPASPSPSVRVGSKLPAASDTNSLQDGNVHSQELLSDGGNNTPLAAEMVKLRMHDSGQTSGTAVSGSTRLDTGKLMADIFQSEDLRAGHARPETAVTEMTSMGQSTAWAGRSSMPKTGSTASDDPRLEMQRQLVELQSELVGEEAQWEVHSQLGKGAYGVVYKGTWRGLEVAVKRIIFQLLSGPEGESSRRTALREAAFNATLHHPNIVTTYTYDMQPLGESTKSTGRGVYDWQLYIIQEFCDGGSLYDAIRARRFWNSGDNSPRLQQALTIASHVAAGCAYIHNKNIIHGDLKPDNVLLKLAPGQGEAEWPGCVAKVADFGMSMKIQGNQTHVSGVHHGTPLYIAPEILADGKASKAADVYSFGVIMWELYHGRSAWEQLIQAQGSQPRGGRAAVYYPGLFTFDSCKMKAYAELGKLCLSDNATERPSFPAILKALAALRANPDPDAPLQLDMTAQLSLAGPLSSASAAPLSTDSGAAAPSRASSGGAPAAAAPVPAGLAALSEHTCEGVSAAQSYGTSAAQSLQTRTPSRPPMQSAFASEQAQSIAAGDSAESRLSAQQALHTQQPRSGVSSSGEGSGAQRLTANTETPLLGSQHLASEMHQGSAGLPVLSPTSTQPLLSTSYVRSVAEGGGTREA